MNFPVFYATTLIWFYKSKWHHVACTTPFHLIQTYSNNLKIVILLYKKIKLYQSLVNSVVIDAEIGMKNHGSIPHNYDPKGAEITWCQNCPPNKIKFNLVIILQYDKIFTYISLAQLVRREDSYDSKYHRRKYTWYNIIIWDKWTHG
jgi:hypothetical protein